MASLYSEIELLATIRTKLDRFDVAALDLEGKLGRMSWWRFVEKKILLELAKKIGLENKTLLINTIEKGISSWSRRLLSGKLSADSHKRASWIASSESTIDIIEELEDMLPSVVDIIESINKVSDKGNSLFSCCSAPQKPKPKPSVDSEKPVKKTTNEPADY